MLRLNLNRLYYFYIVAQYKSFTVAAKALNISQPSLSQQIKIFEEEIGGPLFVRSRRQLELTSSGIDLQDRAKEIFAKVQAIELGGYESHNVERIEFNLGVSDEIERPFITEVVGRVHKASYNGNFKYRIVSKGDKELVRALTEKKIDALVTNRPLAKRKALAEFKFPVFLATNRTQDLFQHLSPSNLKHILNQLQQGFVVSSRETKFGEEVHSFLQKEKKLTVDQVLESNILSCVVRAIRDGVGAGFVPLPYVLSEVRRNMMRIIGPAQGYWTHNVYIYANESTESTTALIQAIEYYLQD